MRFSLFFSSQVELHIFGSTHERFHSLCIHVCKSWKKIRYLSASIDVAGENLMTLTVGVFGEHHSTQDKNA